MLNKNSKKTLNLINDLLNDKDRVNELVDSLKKECQKEYKKLLEFESSGEFTSVIKKIHNYLKSENFISDNSYQDPLFFDVSNEEFILVFDCLFSELFPLVNSKVDPTIQFENEYVVYDNLIFSKIYGQGTSFSVIKK